MSLGSIVVRLTMDTATFDTDAGRAAKIADKRAKEIDAAFRKAGVAIGAALGTAIVGVSAALKKAIDSMDETSKAAQKVGDSTENFSRLVYAGSLADVSMDQLVTTMGKLTKSQAAALNGTSEQAKVFKALGIEVKDAEGNLRSSSDVLLDFADRFKELKGSPEAMAAGFALFGRSFQDMIPLLKDGSAGIREAMQESDALGHTLSTGAGQQAEAFNDNLTRLKSAVEGLAMQVAADLLPDLVDLTDNFVEMTKQGDGVSSTAHDIANGFRAVGDVISFVSVYFKALGDVAEGAGESLTGLYQVASGLLTLDWTKIRAGAMSVHEGQNLAFFGSDAVNARTSSNAPRASFAGVTSRISSISGKDAEAAALKIEAARIKEARAHAEALRKALGDDPEQKKNKTGHKGGKSDSQVQAEQLLASYKSLSEQQRERLALLGKEGEVAKITYDTTEGSLKNLSAAEKQELLNQAAQIDAATEHQRVVEEGKRLIESLLTPEEQINKQREEAAKLLKAGAIAQAGYNKAIASYKTPAEEMLSDLQFERELIGKTREEQELLNAARHLGAEAATEQGQAALSALADNLAYAKQTQDTIDLMDGFRNEAGDLFVSLVDGSKSAKDAFKDFFDNLAEMITKFIASKLIEQAFGQMGSTGGGTQGGGWLSSLFGLFSGSWAGGGFGYASGGYTGDGPVNQIAGPAHKGEVVWSQSDIRRAGGVQTVESMRTGRARSGPNITNINVQGVVSRQTIAQIDRANGRRTTREMSRTGR